MLDLNKGRLEKIALYPVDIDGLLSVSAAFLKTDIQVVVLSVSARNSGYPQTIRTINMTQVMHDYDIVSINVKT